MGGFSFEDENTSPVPPATLYKAWVTDADTIIPKAVDTFKGVEIVEGNGGPGTIKKIIFVEGHYILFSIYLLINSILLSIPYIIYIYIYIY